MNKYEILGVSGEGAYGVVLKCRNKENDAVVAIKKFKDLEDPEDELFKKTTLREIKLLKNATHPNIVRLLEAFKRKERLYLVFEYCDSTILEILEKAHGMPIEDVKLYTFEMLRAVDFLHQNHIIHRDLKPENLLVHHTPRGNTLKLCDFGFARHVNQEGAERDYEPADLTDYVATRWYRAPELLLNSTDYDQTVDVWAIALIIVEMITSEALFPGDSDVDQLYLIQKVIGNLTRKEMEKFLRNPKFIGIKMPDLYGKVEGLEKRLSGKIKDQTLLKLLTSMLEMDPEARSSCEQCLESEWFDSIREEALRQEIELWKELGISIDQPEIEEVKIQREDSEHIERRLSPPPEPVIGESVYNEDLPALPESRTGSRAARVRETQTEEYGMYGEPKNLPSLPKHK